MYSIGPLPSVAVTKVFFLLLIPYAVEVDRARYETAVVQYLLSSLMDQIRSGEYSLLTCGSSGFEDVIGKSAGCSQAVRSLFLRYHGYIAGCARQ